MAADIKMKALVSYRPRNAAHVNAIGFQNHDIDVVLGKQIASREACRTCTDYDDLWLHTLLRDPVAPGEVPDVPALYAQPSSANQRYCRRPQCPHPYWRRAKLTQKIQKRQYDQSVRAELVTQHTFHVDAGDAAHRKIINGGRAEIDPCAYRQTGPAPNRWNEFANCNSD